MQHLAAKANGQEAPVRNLNSAPSRTMPQHRRRGSRQKDMIGDASCDDALACGTSRSAPPNDSLTPERSVYTPPEDTMAPDDDSSALHDKSSARQDDSSAFAESGRRQPEEYNQRGELNTQGGFAPEEGALLALNPYVILITEPLLNGMRTAHRVGLLQKSVRSFL